MLDAVKPEPTIVVVDHCPQTRETAGEALAALGCQVAGVEFALSLFPASVQRTPRRDKSAANPALFLIALYDDDDTGLRVLRWLRGSKRWALLPAIALVDQSSVSQLAEAARLGVSDYMLKPVTPERLREVCQQYLPKPPLPAAAHATVTVPLCDIVSRELSRARRTSEALSLMACTFLESTPVRASSQSACEVGDLDWLPDAVSVAQGALREIDWALAMDSRAMMLVLPLADSEGLSAVETRLHDHMRPLLRRVRLSTGRDYHLVTAQACAPEDAAEWQPLLDCVLARLAEAVEERSGPSRRAA